MARFPVNTHRNASYKRFKFRVLWDQTPIPGFTRVSGLKRTTEVVSERSGAGRSVPHTSPGQTNYDPIVLERGRTHDSSFERWANKVHSYGSGTEVSLKDYKKNVTIELLNEAGQVVMRFVVHGCWPSEYTALSGLDSTDSTAATESLTLQHEGWERDFDTKEPAEPSFSRPSS